LLFSLNGRDLKSDDRFLKELRMAYFDVYGDESFEHSGGPCSLFEALAGTALCGDVVRGDILLERAGLPLNPGDLVEPDEMILCAPGKP
jgi:hypothetical protein